MGWLDKLLGRKKSDAGEGMQTAPAADTMPAGDTHEHSHGEGEGEHSHEHDDDSGGGGGGGAS